MLKIISLILFIISNLLQPPQIKIINNLCLVQDLSNNLLLIVSLLLFIISLRRKYEYRIRNKLIAL